MWSEREEEIPRDTIWDFRSSGDSLFPVCLYVLFSQAAWLSFIWLSVSNLSCGLQENTWCVLCEESRPYTVAGGRGYNQQVPFYMGQYGACSMDLLWISCGGFGLWTTVVEGEKPGDPGILSACCNVKEKFVCIKETRRGKCHWSPFLGSHPSYPYVTLQKYWAYFPFFHLSSFFNLYFSPFQIWPLIANFLIFSMKV